MPRSPSGRSNTTCAADRLGAALRAVIARAGKSTSAMIVERIRSWLHPDRETTTLPKR